MQPPVDYLSTPSELTLHILDREGCPIHYWAGGPQDRPAVFCLPGALMDHRMFNAQVAMLQEDYRVLVWDARGHGKSQPVGLDRPTMEDYCADALAVMQHAGCTQAILLGQSMGAYIAQHLLRSCPERVLGLVLIGSTPIQFALPRWELWSLQASGPIMSLWPWKSLKASMAAYTAETPAVKQYALAAMNQVDLKTFLSIWHAVSRAVRRQGFADFQVEVPFLLTHGDNDRTGTIKRDGPRWAASDRRIRYEVIPQAGHNANQDNPAFFNLRLAEFLSQHF
jgi:3-oxoadipate enol-lactonase